MLRLSEEAARCMLFKGVKGQGQMFESVMEGGKDKQGKGKSLIYCVHMKNLIQDTTTVNWNAFF